MIDIVWDETAAWTVRPYEKISSTSPVRLRDDLYRELVYELVNNALKHGRAVFDDSSEDTPPSAPAVSLQVYVTISPDSDGCALAFRNIIFDERTIQASLRAFISQHNIGVDTPIPIPIRWECNSPTGLECLSRVFDSIKAGEVYWRIWSTRGVYYFEVLVKLFGLTGCLQNPD